MKRATRDAWLTGPGDLAEADVEDVPVKGMSVRVRALSAKYSAEMQAQMKIERSGREAVGRFDIAEMELLQFVHGCVDPSFNEAEARQIQEKYGAAFRKVIAKIDEISGIDKEAIEAAEQRFPAGGEDAARPLVGDGGSAGGLSAVGGPDLPVRVGA
jgi:hypothetical protein